MSLSFLLEGCSFVDFVGFLISMFLGFSVRPVNRGTDIVVVVVDVDVDK